MTKKERGRPQHGTEKKHTYSFVLMPSQFNELMRQAESKGLSRNEYLIASLHLNPSEETR
jgi:hypothetical protein